MSLKSDVEKPAAPCSPLRLKHITHITPQIDAACERLR